MKTVREICQYIAATIPHKGIICVETGCSYTCPPGNEEHTTTNNLVEFICLPSEGHLASYDIDPEHIVYAKELISSLPVQEGQVFFYCGDSVELMRTGWSIFSSSYGATKIDVLCLDSKEFDEDHMVNEYNAVKLSLREKHFVLVDDIHNPNSVKYKKMVPLLKKWGYDTFEVPTPTGMLVASKGYPLPKMN